MGKVATVNRQNLFCDLKSEIFAATEWHGFSRITHYLTRDEGLAVQISSTCTTLSNSVELGYEWERQTTTLNLTGNTERSPINQRIFPQNSIFVLFEVISPAYRMTDSGSNDHPELLSVAQTVELLGVTRQRVHDLIKNGQIVDRKLGRYY